MAYADWQVQGALGGMKAIGSYFLKARQAKADKAWQKYNNALVRIQGAQNQNSITVNEGLLTERTIRAEFAVRQSSYVTQGSAEMAAAAVGAEGNNVERVLAQIKKNETRELSNIQRDRREQALGFAEQRRNSELQTEMAIDRTQIPRPNIVADLLTLAGDTGMKYWEGKLS